MDWTKVIEAIITLIIVIVVSVVIPYIKAKMGAENFEQLKKWVKVAVQAAEMIYTETGMGEKKKKYVEEFLRSLGVKVNYYELNGMIESAVLELKRELNESTDSNK